MKNPNYLLQVNSVLYAYYTLEILLLDVLSNPMDGVNVYEARVLYGRLSYEPVSLETLRRRNREYHANECKANIKKTA